MKWQLWILRNTLGGGEILDQNDVRAYTMMWRDMAFHIGHVRIPRPHITYNIFAEDANNDIYSWHRVGVLRCYISQITTRWPVVIVGPVRYTTRWPVVIVGPVRYTTRWPVVIVGPVRYTTRWPVVIVGPVRYITRWPVVIVGPVRYTTGWPIVIMYYNLQSSAKFELCIWQAVSFIIYKET